MFKYISSKYSDYIPDSEDKLYTVIKHIKILITDDSEIVIDTICKWDSEHDCAIKIYPKFEIGSLDMYI